MLSWLKRGIARMTTAQARLQRLSDRYVWARVFVFVSALVLVLIGIAANIGWAVVYALLTVAVGVFAVVLFAHRRVTAQLWRAQQWIALKQAHLARARLDWDGLPSAMPYTPQEQHPFEMDLDIIGAFSVHRLMNVAATQQGADRLRAWLTATTPDLPTIEARQRTAAELSLAFCDRLALASRTSNGTGPLGSTIDTQTLRQWAQAAPPSNGLGWAVVAAALCTTATLILYGVYQFGGGGVAWFAFPLLAYVAIFVWRLRDVGELVSVAYALRHQISAVRGVLTFLEAQNAAQRPSLRALIAAVQGDARPSTHLNALEWIVGAALVRINPIAWLVLNLSLPFDLFVAYRLGVERRRLAALLPAWLEAWHELEALAALAVFAHTHPTYTLPQIDPARAVFAAQGLGHPLIAPQHKVSNDLRFDAAADGTVPTEIEAALGTVLVITGSNMSGKSSFLRTLGVNTVLTNAGAVVNAERLQIGLLRPFTCIRVSDSLADGFSYFYAEVLRLQALLHAFDDDTQPPLLFLIDEIFKGTNNRERLQGSRAYIERLLGERGLGAVSTHDLELATIPAVVNYHFADDVTQAKLTFDYTLRAGPCPTTNALRIMAAAGLPIG
jgi:ABC-type multidrug transport system fused ATPase/permease subunit